MPADELAPTDVGPLESVFRTRYGRLVGVARLLIDDPAEADELVQEAFARTWARRPDLATPAEAAAYLHRVVINLARDRVRRRVRARRLPVPPERTAPAADSVVFRNDDQRRLVAAVRSLPSRQRECVVLRYLLECSTTETASALDIAEGSVKSHLSRALAALGTDLEGTR